MNPQDQRDYEAFKKLLDRVGKAISMSNETEVTEIIRRRLFEWYGLPDEGKRTAAAYAAWAAEHAPELANLGGENPGEVFRNAYPFHPAVISVFERKWQALPRFQRTRGILRLLAMWVARTYREDHRRAVRDPLITLGSAPLEDQIFRDAVFEQLSSDQLSIPVTTDIVGKSDAHAICLDREATDSIKKTRLH
jgi:predicted AAA+ superfamily ATPase